MCINASNPMNKTHQGAYPHRVGQLKQKEQQQSTRSSDLKTVHPIIAIVGASYSGLTIANVLDLNSIPYIIFESKPSPFTYVTGGTFDVPSYESVVQTLRLNVKIQKKATAHHTRIENGTTEETTRTEVISALWERVKENVFCGGSIVDIEDRGSRESPAFYLHLTRLENTNECVFEHGPYRCIIGADGALSKCRSAAMHGTYLIGDARWVNDRWYDFGLRRINKGADLALLDGIELGQKIVKHIQMRNGGSLRVGNVEDVDEEGKFSSEGIRLRLVRRRVMVVVLLLAILFKVVFQ